MATLIAIVFVALGISFLCSILEAALLTTRDTELAERAGEGERGATILQRLKTEHLDDSISSILILNTVAHTIGAAMAGAQAARVFGDTWVGVFSAVLTLLVLVFTEIIPKTIGAAYASQLVSFVAYTLSGLRILLWPALAITRLLTRLIPHPPDSDISKGEVRAMVRTAAKKGLLRPEESQIVLNALRLGQVSVQDVMTPRTVVGRLSADAPADTLRNQSTALPYTRIPIFEDGEEDIVGYVRLPDVLQGAGPDDDSSVLRDFVRPILDLEATTSVGDALRDLVRRGDHIALVRDSFGGVAGIVTMEDLIETLLGAEILDESDEVADLREFAVQLRDERLSKRGEDSPSD